ncbi:putative vacuolar protein sorting-associated protein [Lupinus albus]|uniref:Putative vacuolar protein sorting-associated protein n=1 Tax=Lupinus albus TaxID=3870 RepID=A0A6A4P4N3_LUPAL|nr:putative vacuolar protein sorting-associated protein [Lupinus albus]
MGNFHTKCAENVLMKKQALPIETIFKLPVATPIWPPGDGFASGIIDLGGLQVFQISNFNKVWATYQGGSDNQGATVFEPKGIPQGFCMLGSYIQPNNKPLFGWVLVAKDVSSSTTNGTLKKPIDYTLVWSTASMMINQDSPAYFWLPTAPDGYKAVGHVVTTTQDKPSLERIRCVRLDLTDQCQTYSWIWGQGKSNDPNGFNVYDVRPTNKGTHDPGVSVGTFVAQNSGTTNPLSIACLKNTNANSKSMPNLQQVEAIVKAYSPSMYLHPNEKYLPSSINWFFSNGALLYKKGEESKPIPIAPNGINLPQGGNNDGAYWLDLPADEANKDRVKKGDLSNSKSYIHVKPMLGGTFTDIVMWVFYPFNGPARAKVEFINLNLGKIGEHVGDWEHVTLRVSNLNGQLCKVYFSQHSKGAWVEASQLEFQNGNNKPVIYSSLHGHACYPHAGLDLQGKDGIGIRNDSAKSNVVMDMGAFELVSAEYLESEVIEPPWLNYFKEWGPKIEYNIDYELKKVEKILPGKLKRILEKIVKGLPSEVLGEEGPLGPKLKNNWIGDEV